MKRCVVIGLSLIVVLVGVLAACAGPAPTPTPTVGPSPTATSTPGALAQIIAGAQKEGTVSVILRTGFTPKSMERLMKEIKDRFGVDLKIQFTPSRTMPKDLADAILEYQAGATPTFDLMLNMTNHTAQGNKAGVYEIVDWKPLITADTNPEVVLEPSGLRGAILNFTGHLGLLYNPEKVLEAQAPKTLSELADPKWKSKVAIFNYSGSWVRWAYILGKEKVHADLRAILKNKVIQGPYQDELNRYLLGEVWMAFVASMYMKEAQQKGVPVAWQNLDFAEVQKFVVLVRKGAAHPNAAKLVAVYMASPAGAKFSLEESYAGNQYYAGNYEHDITLQGKRQGLPEYELSNYPGLLEFHFTDEYTQWEKELNLILQTGG